MLDENRVRLEELSREHQTELNALSEAEKGLAAIDTAFQEERRQLATIEQEASDLRAQRDRIEHLLSQAKSKIQDLSARRQALSDMEAAREGYHRGVRAVLLAAKARGWGLKGAVAELIRVSKEHETAIEVALGGAAQHVVARRDEDAKAAIAYLKESKAGRATFLPLGSLKVNALTSEAKREIERIGGVIGVASSLVDVEEECRPAVEYLLGRVVITRDLDAAIAVSRKIRGVSPRSHSTAISSSLEGR